MTNNGPREIPMMMKPFLMPMVMDGSKTQSRRLGERWKKVKVGDRVWMREAYKIVEWDAYGSPRVQYTDGSSRWIDQPDSSDQLLRLVYMRDEMLRNGKTCDQKWRPAVHMPRSVCRFVGEVIGVRQEFLQDITNEDAKAEGMVRIDFGKHFSESRWNQANKATQDVESLQRRRFARLMECMTPGIWAANPVVTVVEWRKV